VRKIDAVARILPPPLAQIREDAAHTDLNARWRGVYPVGDFTWPAC
jgi:hypothetical protein